MSALGTISGFSIHQNLSILPRGIKIAYNQDQINGNKSKIILEIFSLSGEESSFVVKVRYFKPDADAAFYTSYSKISAWTYNKIKEITL